MANRIMGEMIIGVFEFVGFLNSKHYGFSIGLSQSNITKSKMADHIFAPVSGLSLNFAQFGTQTLLSNEFLVGSISADQRILLVLTSSHILLCQNANQPTVTNFLQLTFQLKFQVLRLAWPDDKTPGLPIGIRFELGSASAEFFSPNNSLVIAWERELEKKINQRSFHKLFKAKRKIGKGAFAAVYLAERLTDGKMVAVKAFSKEKQYSTDKGKESLQNEIRIMREVDHSNIIKLEGVFQTENSIYVIVENLEGSQLNDFLRAQKQFTEAEITNVMRELLRGLSHLANKGIIHRDLKPENMMFRKENCKQLVIVDFGLSTYANVEKYLFVRCGTPGFVAPEIINIRDMSTKSEPISDIFSAGLIFHFLLFGRSVFPGRTYHDVLAQNRVCEFNFEQERYASTGFSSMDLLTRMLDRNPRTRITAQQALKHPFFQNKMQLEDIEADFPLKKMHNCQNAQRQHFDHVAEIGEEEDMQQKKEQRTPSVFDNSTNRSLRKRNSISINNENPFLGGKENCSPKLRKNSSYYKNGNKTKKGIKKLL